MKVFELIEILKRYPQDLPVAYPQWSEQLMLEFDDVSMVPLCEARPDGWIQNYREDKPSINYLVIGK